MIHEPLISIIIPHYNRPLFLAETINSCLSQDNIRLEIIVVDDGSTIPPTIPQPSSSRVTIKILCQTNNGACAARNRGIEESHGDFIKFIDSDDLLSPNILNKQLKHILESGADVVYGDFEMFGDLTDPRVGGKPGRITGEVNDPVAALLGDWWCAPFCYLYRRKVIENVKWRVDLPCLQDFDYILRVAMDNYHFSYVPGKAGFYRVHGNQITSTFPLKYAKARCTILDNALKKLSSCHTLTKERKENIANGYWSAARSFYKNDKAAFDSAVEKVYQLSPKFSPSLWAPWPVRYMTRLLGIEYTEKILDVRRSLLSTARNSALSN